MNNGWTGGQYSLYRVLVGAYLFGASLSVVFLRGAWPWSLLIGAVATVCSVAFALGWYDRVAASVLLALGTAGVLLARIPLEPSRLFVGWLLVAHLFLPAAPYGSVAAAGRSDPGGGWRLHDPVYVTTWILMALWYSYVGYSMLIYPGWLWGREVDEFLFYHLSRLPSWMAPIVRAVEPAVPWILRGVFAVHLLFVPLAIFDRVRPWLWLFLTTFHLLGLGLLGNTGFSLRMLLLQVLALDPAWIRPRDPDAREVLYYDGSCGLCHRSVRFLLAEDEHRRFRFAPIDSEAFCERVSEEQRAELPDSLVLQTSDGALLFRASGVLRVASRLGGLWRVLGGLAGLLPRGLRDTAYDLIARVRYRLFARPEEACPLVTDELRSRFLVDTTARGR